MTAPVRVIELSIEKLRRLTQVDVRSNWRYSAVDLPWTSVRSSDEWQDWPFVELNEKGQIVWEGGRQVLWLVQKLVIPNNLQGYPLEGLTLRLALTWWAEDVQIFVNDRLVQSGDLFDYFTRVVLSASAIEGEEISIALRLVSPSHDRGALMRSLCVYESGDEDFLEPGFVADELAVHLYYIESFAPEKLDVLETAVAEIDWSILPDREKFDRCLSKLRQTLQSQIQNPKSKISLLGHAHLDMAWLWPVSETWIAAQRTFASVLQLQQDFPELIFCHSTPALYEWIEKHRPDLFADIQKQVIAGRWEVVGGMWVEPDLNLIDGESIVRQILYGQRYVREKFDRFSTIAWVPDSFGFCATLPQFLKQGGIEYFVTQKLAWNDTTKFPYGVFWWQSPDGTQIFSLMSALIGETIDPIKMMRYAIDWQIKTGLHDALWLPGVGDHGGGPTRDMLETSRRWQKSPFFPKLEFTSAENYLSAIATPPLPPPSTGGEERKESDSEQLTADIPVWHEELYLEFHRGCYTTHADQKRSNRRCEALLYQAELFSSLAAIAVGLAYPKAELSDAWKKVLFNQFHDILPGTSIPAVFADANRAWGEVEQVGAEIWQNAMSAIASQIALSSPPHPDALPLVVFNSLNWARSAVVSIPLPTSETLWQVFDSEKQPLSSQLSHEKTLLFVANNVPSIGYRVFWLCPQKAETLANSSLKPEISPIGNSMSNHNISILQQNREFVQKDSLVAKDWILENELLRVIVGGESGNLTSVFDKVNCKEILQEAGGNQLQAFQDSGQYWDAWNIDPKYQEHPLPATVLKSIEWIERGEVRQRLRIVRELGESEICQDYVLDVGDAVLQIVTSANWQENHVLLKAAFPLNLTADSVTYEIPCGAIGRTTRPETEREKAKWEVSALRWADLTEKISDFKLPIEQPMYGVSLLNDCKYGYDSQPNQLRLTLLRSPSWPDPQADRGYHQFTYALYPHSGDWRSAGTVRRGYELNLPLQAIPIRSVGEKANSRLPDVGQLLNLSAENLILIAFKQSEDRSDRWILRCYECHGEAAQLQLQSDVGLEIVNPVDLLERPVDAPAPLPDNQTFNIAPWKIVSFQIKSSR
ncbi:alpha-mannosidase [Aerosakkonema sp. BLCC-F183]|uniref:alpha-mannosidase n=1 Tax=Aerosakkonema sp. BLCC-F183 TaxID=3342834 RepID=UPI0035B79643